MLLNVVNRLASLRFAITSLVSVAAAVIYFYHELPGARYLLTLAFIAVMLNLVSAIATRPAFHRQPSLMLFHMALAAMLVLVAIGRLVYMRGHVELVQGQLFSPEQVEYQAGLLHQQRLDNVAFINESYSIEYHPGVRRGSTQNLVSWRAPDGKWQRGIIGDNRPLVIDGYRFYTSFNKGYAPTFSWQPTGSSIVETGAVHLPGYPLREFEQARKWEVPSSDLKLWTQMVLEEEVLKPRDFFKLGAIPRHYLVVRDSTNRYEMRPGDRIQLPEGVLIYRELRTWMGYTIYYDWTHPWLVAAGILALISMGRYYYRKFSTRSWQQVGEQTKTSAGLSGPDNKLQLKEV